MLSVSMGTVPATGLLARTTLTEEQTSKLFGGGALTVCATPSKAHCGRLERIRAGRPVQIYLQPRYTPSPGKYTGTVQLLAAEGRSEPATVTLYVTSWFWKAWGLAMLALGLVLSLILTVGVRNGLQRVQLLAPAGTLQDAFAGLEARLPSPTNRAEQTRKIIGAWRDSLSTVRLEQFGYVPIIFSVAPPSTAKAAAYQELLNRASAAASAVGRMLDGFDAVAAAERAIPASEPDPSRALVEAAWSEMDSLSARARADLPNAAVVSEVEAEIAAILARLRGSVGVQAAGISLEPLRRASERIRFQISTLSLASWLFVALITFVVGAYVLVLSRPDFGRVQDFVICLLWSFGLPAAGAQLSQLSPASLAASVGITRPATT